MEKKLTVKERNKIYKKVYEETFKDSWYNNEFICNNIEETCNIPRRYIFDCFSEFNLFKPENYLNRDPFIMTYYNNGIQYTPKEFTPIQQTILAFCIIMTE